MNKIIYLRKAINLLFVIIFSCTSFSYCEAQNTTQAQINFQQLLQLHANENRTNGYNKNLWMSLYFKDAQDSLYLQDGMLTGFDDSYSIQVDNDDVRKFLNASDNLGIMRFGQQLIVERRPDIYGDDTTFLSLAQTRYGNYKFVTNFENMNEAGFEARLVDKFLNNSTSLSLIQPTHIEFNISGAPGSAATDRFVIVYKRTALLPVTITSVSASRNNDRSIAVKWNVENESLISKYEVERSANGINFTGILTTNATGASTGKAVYDKNDNSPLAADNFYRIKAYSTSGQIQYSAIVKVAAFNAQPSVTVSPNPVQNSTINLHFINQVTGKYKVELTNAAGQIIYRNNILLVNGNVTKSLRMSVAAGNYQLSVISEKGIKQTQQILML